MPQPALVPPDTTTTDPPTPVPDREFRVWRAAEAIPGAIVAAFAVGLPLRALLPADVRFTLVAVVLAGVSAVVVLVAPELVMRPVAWLAQGLARLAFSPAPALGRYISVHGHAHGAGSGTRRKIAKHEAGHAVAAEALGGQVVSAEIYDGDRGGLVQAHLPGDPKTAVAFLLAGQYAVNSSEGASGDNDAIRKVLLEVPSRERGQVKSQAKREARRIVSSQAGEIRRVAAALDEKGRL